MSAYGQTICPYCNICHYDLDIHECNIQVLKNEIDRLKANEKKALNTLNELNEASTVLMGQIEKLLKQLNDMYELVKTITPNNLKPY